MMDVSEEQSDFYSGFLLAGHSIVWRFRHSEPPKTIAIQRGCPLYEGQDFLNDFILGMR